MKMKINAKIDLPSFMFSIRRFLMKPLAGEYQLLEAKTWTFSNSEGFEFLVVNTFSPPMRMVYIILDACSCWRTSMVIHSPEEGSILKYLEKLNLPPTAEDIRKPLEESVQMAGVLSPYLAPLPAPFPPTVMWNSCSKPVKLSALKSKETFHSFFRRGMVAKRWFLLILCSSLREYPMFEGPAIQT